MADFDGRKITVRLPLPGYLTIVAYDGEVNAVTYVSREVLLEPTAGAVILNLLDEAIATTREAGPDG